MAQASQAIFGKSRESGCCGYRGGLVFKAHRLLYHSSWVGPVARVKKKRGACPQPETPGFFWHPPFLSFGPSFHQGRTSCLGACPKATPALREGCWTATHSSAHCCPGTRTGTSGSTLNPQPQALNPKPRTPNPKPLTPNHQPSTRNWKPET